MIVVLAVIYVNFKVIVLDKDDLLIYVTCN